MAKKNMRNMKVYEQSGYNYKSTPMIMLKGQWLKELGFESGQYISVVCEDGKLIITPNEEKMREAEAEKLFMEREEKKLKELMKKDKKEFLEQMVAERMEAYNEWEKMC